MYIIHVQEYVRVNGSWKTLIGFMVVVAKNAGLRTDVQTPPGAPLHNTVTAVSTFNPARATNSFSPNIISKGRSRSALCIIRTPRTACIRQNIECSTVIDYSRKPVHKFFHHPAHGIPIYSLLHKYIYIHTYQTQLSLS